MTLNNNLSRGNAATPTQDKSKNGNEASKQTNGGHLTNGINGGHLTMAAKAPNWKGPEQIGGVKAANGDPFGQSSNEATEGVKLSGNAVTFNPNGTKPSPIDLLNHNSYPDDGPVIVSSSGRQGHAGKQDSGKAKAVQQPIGTRGENFSPSRPPVTFTTDVGPGVVSPGGHYIKIENVSNKEYDHTLRMLCDNFGWRSKIRGWAVPRPENNSNYLNVYASFDDIRDAVTAISEAELVNPRWNAYYITQGEYASHMKAHNGNSDQEESSYHDGQVVFEAHFKGLSNEFTLDGLFERITELAMTFGEVIGVREMEVNAGNRQYRVEFFKINAAKNVVSRVTEDDPAEMGKWVIVSKEIPDHTVQASPEHGTTTNGTPHKAVHNGQVVYYSPTGRSAWTIDENGVEVPAPALRQLPNHQSTPLDATTPGNRMIRHSDPAPLTPANFSDATVTPRSESWPGQSYANYSAMDGGHFVDTDENTHNKLSRDKIIQGIDVRTTVMLRNMPFGMTVEKLKVLLDKAIPGLYDFLYLRFDFKKNSNVGYAFVNFNDPLDIVKLLEYYEGKEWEPSTGRPRPRPAHMGPGPPLPPRAPRIAHMCYATVQGNDCLVEKFRNSAIMDEFNGWRPKLFYTFETAPTQALIGQEKPFPPVNNPSKHQRSLDNATQVGLYAPGKYKNQGRRPRNSQFDRGTPAQLREDAYYNQMPPMNQMSPVQNGLGFNNANYYHPQGSMPGVPGSPYGGMFYGNMSPHMNGSAVVGGPVFGPNGVAYMPFYNPFNNVNGNGPNNTPARMPNCPRRLGGERAREIVVPPRDLQTSIRQNEFNRTSLAAYEAAQANGMVPRVIEAEESGNMNYSAFTADNGQGSNGGHGPNGFGHA